MNNNYYIEVARSDPRNDCRPAIPSEMFNSANRQLLVISSILGTTRRSLSSREKLDLIDNLRKVEVDSLSVIMETVYGEYLSRKYEDKDGL